MSSITNWTRLEPHTRTPDIRLGLQAQVHDPLWMLARQWQFGELQGEDVGSPVTARLEAQSSQLSRYHAGPLPQSGSVSAVHYNSQQLPLETLVERDRIHQRSSSQLRLCVEAGLQFLRLLNSAGLSSYRTHYQQAYPLSTLTNTERQQLDRESLQFLNLMGRRALNGEQLYRDLSGNPAQAFGKLTVNIPNSDRAALSQVIRLWLQWHDTLLSEPAEGNATWSSERMEYAFAVSASTSQGEVVLTASEYAEGHLDWSAFNLHPGISLGATGTSETIRQAAIPAPVTYRGMPVSRWWEFEDSQVNFNAVEANPEDLARLLLVEFALIYGNDWFVIPVDLPVGSLCQIQRLEVIDSFGDRTFIQPCGSSGGSAADWKMFQLSVDRRSNTSATPPTPPIFFLPPVLGSSLQSAPVEEVLFLRDEMANMAWAVERVIESPTGRLLNRWETDLQQQNPSDDNSATSSDRPLTYHLSSDIPTHWLPLLPEAVGPASIRLRRGGVLPSPNQSTPHQPLGQILQPGRPLALYEEEIPRAGAQVTRAYQYARWIDGSTHVWSGQRKRPGRGEGSSNLQFDTIK